MYKLATRSGFTLVELMIVVVLIAISVGVTGDVLTSLVRSYNKTQVTTEIEQQANYIKLKLEKELRGASGIQIRDSGATLIFRSSNGEDVTYKVNSGSIEGVVTREVASSGEEWITSNIVPGGANVYCSRIGGVSGSECPDCFSVISPASGGYAISICLVLRQASGSVGSSFTGKTVLQSTIVPRGVYSN